MVRKSKGMFLGDCGMGQQCLPTIQLLHCLHTKVIIEKHLISMGRAHQKTGNKFFVLSSTYNMIMLVTSYKDSDQK